MTKLKDSTQLDETEERFIEELKMKSPQELGNFLAGPWTASILSSEAIEDLYKYQKLQQEEMSQQRTAKELDVR